MVLSGLQIGKLAFVGNIEARERFWGIDQNNRASPGEVVNYLLDPVQKPAHVLNHRELQQVWHGDWIDEQRAASANDEDGYSWTGEPLWTAFARTLCADIVKSDCHSTPDHRLGKDFRFTEDDLRLLTSGTLPITLERRVFAATSLGHYCLMRDDARLGDLAISATGAETPYLLRPKDEDRFEFLGYCYVHSLMDGEAFRAGESKIDVNASSISEFRVV